MNLVFHMVSFIFQLHIAQPFLSLLLILFNVSSGGDQEFSKGTSTYSHWVKYLVFLFLCAVFFVWKLFVVCHWLIFELTMCQCYSLVSLQEDLVENVPCILFWNKHYHTIVKVKTQLLLYFITLGAMLAAFCFSFLTLFDLMQINGVLHSLVTDSNYLETCVVWQTLDGVCYSVFFIISV